MPKKTVIYDDTECYVNINYYISDPDVMAITLIDASDHIPYTVLSVNLPRHRHMGLNRTYIDTNNCLCAEKFLENLKEAHPVLENGQPVTEKSGFCEYPLYEFDEDFLKELDPTGYAEYASYYKPKRSTNYGK